MSEENLKLAQRGYDAFNRGDIDGVLELCAPHVEWNDIDVLDTPAVKGKDAVRAYFVTILEPWEVVRREPEEMIDLGDDRVLALIHLTGRGKGSGIEVDNRGADLVTYKKGKLVRWVAYQDRAQALEAAGLSE
jgi:ketosteroid isomerase-like protein